MNEHSLHDKELNIKHALKEIANQAYKLATGLQCAAPAHAGGPSDAVRYLLEISLHLEKVCQEIEGGGLAEKDSQLGSL